MLHDTPLITTIVLGLVLAFIFGAIANRLKMPPLVGYLIAGVAVGPYTPGLHADTELASQLSELGIVLLMFGVGLNFSLKDLISVQALAVPGALIRIAVATVMGWGLGTLLGWPLPASLLFGFSLSIASTVVVLTMLHDKHLLDSDKGHIVVGWVIVEDMATVLALVLIPALAAFFVPVTQVQADPFVDLIEKLAHIQLGTWGVVGVTAVKLAAFIGFMLVVGRRLIPMILHFTAHTGSRELFRLAVLAIALGVAAGAAYLFGVSLALGAFFAGMILSESQLSQRAAQESLPLRDAFAVLFFVAVGMLFDPTIIWEKPLPLLGTIAIIMIGRSVVSYFTVLLFRRPIGTALVVTASLAQIGEFSFVLATLGLGLGIFTAEARDLIVAGAIISIVLNPLLFWIAGRLQPMLEPKPATPEPAIEPSLGEVVPPPFSTAPVAPPPPAAEVPVVATAHSNHTVLIGYGRVGTVVADGLRAAHMPFVLIEDAENRVAAARAAGIEVIEGNAATPDILARANVSGAANVMIAIPNAFEAGQATEQCRKHSDKVIIIARAHSDEEEKYLLDLGANQVILGEREIGLGMVDIITTDRKALGEVVASDAVTAALAPLAASARGGPDIFAPAVEPPTPTMVAIEPMLAPVPVPLIIPETAVPAPPPIEAEPAIEAAAPALAAPEPEMPAPVQPEPSAVLPPEPEEPREPAPIVVDMLTAAAAISPVAVTPADTSFEVTVPADELVSVPAPVADSGGWAPPVEAERAVAPPTPQPVEPEAAGGWDMPEAAPPETPEPPPPETQEAHPVATAAEIAPHEGFVDPWSISPEAEPPAPAAEPETAALVPAPSGPANDDWLTPVAAAPTPPAEEATPPPARPAPAPFRPSNKPGEAFGGSLPSRQDS